jgi:hypothetical protein
MRNYFNLIAFVVILLLTVSACKSDLDLDDTLKFSKLSVEDQKQKIEENGLAFIDRMVGMKETETYSAFESLSERGDALSSMIISPLKSAMESKDVNALSKLKSQLLQPISEDGEIWGQYEWDFDYEEMEFIKELNNKLIMKFPSSDKSKTNDAIFTLEYTESGVEMPEGDVYFPSDINCELEIDGNVVMLFTFSADYNSDGTPNKSSSTLELEDYKWSESYKNDNEELTVDYEFSYQKETLVKLTSTINGDDLTLDNMNEAETPDEMFKKGYFNFQMIDLGILGGIKDMAALAADMEELDDSDYDYDSEEYTDETVKIINKHLIMYAYFVDDNKKFADVEFYTYEYSDTYTNWEYDYDLGQWIEIEETEVYYEMKPRMILSDGSKVDLSEYFESGFDELFEEMENFMEDIPAL